MKYVVTWEPRASASEEMQARSLQVFSKWSPNEGTTFEQFLGRIDGGGGFAVVETDDPALILHDLAIFGAFFEMKAYPCLDIQESTKIAGEAVAFRQSVS